MGEGHDAGIVKAASLEWSILPGGYGLCFYSPQHQLDPGKPQFKQRQVVGFDFFSNLGLYFIPL